MNYTPKNLQYSNYSNTTVDMEILHPTYGWIPFTASADDPESHGRELYSKAIAGDFGTIAPYAGLNEIEIDAMYIRSQRDQLLSEVDIVVSNPLRWNDMTKLDQQLWSEYRQLLLDVPQQEGFPSNVIWPIKPT